VALSEDGGKTFPMIRHMELGEGYVGEENRTNNRQYEYPYLMQGKDGMLHLAFAWKNRVSNQIYEIHRSGCDGRKKGKRRALQSDRRTEPLKGSG